MIGFTAALITSTSSNEPRIEMRCMANPSADKRRRRGAVSGLVMTLAFALAMPGCAQRVYRADRLPVELVAKMPVPIDAINLSGLADPTVQADVVFPGDVLEITMVTDYSKLTTSATPARVAQDGTGEVPTPSLRVNSANK